MKLKKKEILEYQQNRPPYLMIDFVDEVIPGKSAKGYKDLTEDEWFFKVHWPEGNKGKLVYLIAADKIKLQKKIIPNDRLIIETKVNSYKRGIAKCQGKGEVNNKLACSAEFTIVMPHVINYYKKK